MKASAYSLPLVVLLAACTSTTIEHVADDADGGGAPPDDGGSTMTADGGADPSSTTTWTVFPSGTVQNILAIWGSGADDVWYSTDQSQLYHFDGTAWTQYASGGPSLTTIWGTSKNNVYAAGDSELVHFDGSMWSDVSPQVTTGTINAVGGTDANDVWVVGQYVGSGNLRHFNGTDWDYSNGHDPPASSSSDVLYAVSGDWVLGEEGTLLHWNGVGWDSEGEMYGPTMNAGWGTSEAARWFVGGSNTVMLASSGQVVFESDTLDGEFPLTDDASESLYGVWGSSTASVWSVGSKGHIIHRDSNDTWSLATSPTTKDLHCIWGSGPNDIWVGGTGVLLHYAVTK